MVTPGSSAADVRSAPNRWAVLALLGVAQLMVVLDATVVNIALPSAQQALHFSADNRQWIITAYALAFGSLLLLGGKLGDLFGRKWTFVAGLVGFSVASAIGGLAQSFPVLVAARGLQGAFGALLAPSALSLLTITFAGSADRAKAFGIFSGIAAAGGSLGLLLGGTLTQLVSWRWCLYINLVIALPTALVALRLLTNVRPATASRIDLAGLGLGSAGVFGIVFGLSHAETDSWTATVTLVALIAGGLLLAAFVAVESRVTHPLLPLALLRDRTRAAALASIGLSFAALFGVFLFLTFYLQRSLGLSPLTTGLAFLPLTGSTFITAGIVQTRLLPRTGVRPLVVAGMALGAGALLYFSRLTPTSTYAGAVLPAMIVLGMGIGAIFAPSISSATLGVDPQQAGVASALVNTSQQIGGAIGTTLLSTSFATAVRGYVAGRAPAASVLSAATIHGYTVAFTWGAGLLVLGLFVALVVYPAAKRAGSSNTSAAQSSLPRPTMCPRCQTDLGAGS